MRSFTYAAYNRKQFAPPPGDYIDIRVLAANTVEKHTVPEDAKYVVFSSSANFYAKIGDTNVVAAVPAADVTDGSGSELNPEAREIPDDTGFISLISAEACIISMTFYSA